MTTAEPFVLISSPDNHQEFEQKYQRSIGESRLNADLGAPKVPMANNDDIWFCPPALAKNTFCTVMLSKVIPHGL